MTKNKNRHKRSTEIDLHPLPWEDSTLRVHLRNTNPRSELVESPIPGVTNKGRFLGPQTGYFKQVQKTSLLKPKPSLQLIRNIPKKIWSRPSPTLPTLFTTLFVWHFFRLRFLSGWNAPHAAEFGSCARSWKRWSILRRSRFGWWRKTPWSSHHRAGAFGTIFALTSRFFVGYLVFLTAIWRLQVCRTVEIIQMGVELGFKKLHPRKTCCIILLKTLKIPRLLYTLKTSKHLKTHQMTHKKHLTHI